MANTPDSIYWLMQTPVKRATITLTAAGVGTKTFLPCGTLVKSDGTLITAAIAAASALEGVFGMITDSRGIKITPSATNTIDVSTDLVINKKAYNAYRTESGNAANLPQITATGNIVAPTATSTIQIVEAI
jgi:hypothetical protein